MLSSSKFYTFVTALAVVTWDSAMIGISTYVYIIIIYYLQIVFSLLIDKILCIIFFSCKIDLLYINNISSICLLRNEDKNHAK